MKKLIALLLVAAMCVGLLCACAQAFPQKAETSAPGRAHRRSGPQNGGKSAGALCKNRGGTQPYHPDDHAQHEGRHPVRQPADYDA